MGTEKTACPAKVSLTNGTRFSFSCRFTPTQHSAFTQHFDFSYMPTN